MAIKVSTYNSTSSFDTSGKAVATNNAEEQSFQDVLVLNQSALKAMTIDAMVKQSSTGAINPDSVNAAAIMKFRSTLGANIKAPIPMDDPNLGKPIKVNVPSVNSTVTNPGTSQKPTINGGAATPSGNTPIETQKGAPILDEATGTTTNTNTTIPNSGVLECSDELNQYFQKAADTYNVDVKLLKCIAYAESNFRPNATSKSGAMGIMQLMPKTAEGLGVRDGYDAEQNILGGAKYISIQLNRFDGNIEYALAAYNAGPNRVQEYGGVPPFEETQNYVKKIMNIYNTL